MLDHMLEHEWIHLLTLWSSLNAIYYLCVHACFETRVQSRKREQSVTMS